MAGRGDVGVHDVRSWGDWRREESGGGNGRRKNGKWMRYCNV